MVDKLSVSEERMLCEKTLWQPMEMTVQDSRGSCSQLFVACKVSDNLNLQGMHARSQLENDYTEEICGVTTDIL